jgi:8-oxo-dGTP diphosphatase
VTSRDEESNQGTVRVGVGVTILREGRLLLGRRRGSHGAGEYSSPGGHLDYMESFAACARRETAEECGVEIGNVRVHFVANVTRYAPRHYVHLGVLADWVSGEPRVLEAGKCDGWAWYPLDELPEPLFEMTRLAVRSLRSGETCFDAA